MATGKVDGASVLAGGGRLLAAFDIEYDVSSACADCEVSW